MPRSPLRRTTSAVLAAAALSLATAPLHAQLVNGGFEAPAISPGGFLLFGTGGSFPGWTVVGSPVNVGVVSDTYTSIGYLFPSHGGVQWMDLTGLVNGVGGIQQTFTTTPGTAYDLSFWVGNIVDPTGSYGLSSTIDVLVDGTPLLSATNSDGAGTITQSWRRFATSFVATSASTTLAFLNADPASDNTNGLDDVELTPVVSAVPEPAPVALLGGGTLLLLAVARRRGAGG